jgi:hypothetical protein
MFLEMETKPRVPKLGSIHYITYATLKKIWKGDFIDGSMLPSTLATVINLHQLGFDHFAYLTYSGFVTIFFVIKLEVDFFIWATCYQMFGP